MRFKKIVPVLIVLLGLLTAGAVSASENITSDNLSADNDLIIESTQCDDVLSDSTAGNMTELSALIEGTPEGGTLELDKDYTGKLDTEFFIEKSMTIDGKNHRLDIDSTTEIFRVDNCKFYLKNIVFTSTSTVIDGYTENGGGGIINCSFINCSSDYGLISLSGMPNFTVRDCNFKNLISEDETGYVINIGSDSGDICNCNFENINVVAIQSHFDDTTGNITNCRFVSCYSYDNGGAITVMGEKFNIAECDFVNCSCENYGGAIMLQTENQANIVGCSFTDCHSGMSGGAISGYGNITDCRFLGCSADENGGAINFDAYSYGNVINCSFEKCSSMTGGAIFAEEESEVRISASYFENNKATDTGGAVYGGVVFNSVLSKNSAPEIDSDNNYAEVIPKKIYSNDDGVIVLEFPHDAKGTLTVFINETHQKVYDIVGGILEIDLSKFKGEYSLTFQYSGDENYPSFSKNAFVVVSVIPTKITAKDAKVTYSAGQKYTLKVYESEGKIAKKASVTVKINGKKFKTVKTNSKGVASFKVTQSPGKYKVQMTSLGKTVTKTLTVKHIVTLKKVTVKRSAKKLVLTASLAKVNKKYLKNKKITFKFNGKKYTAKTNKKGIAKVTVKSSVLKKLKKGKKVTYQATYLKDTVKQTVKVK